jgi:hypothetical protein
MSAVWKYLIGAVVVLVIGAGAYFGYRYYHSLKKPPAGAFEAITPETGLFIEIKDLISFSQKLTTHTDLWQELIKIPTLKSLHEELMFFDSIFRSGDYIRNVVERQRLLVALQLTGEENLYPVYILELPPTESDYTIADFVKRINGPQSIIMHKNYRGANIELVNISEREKIFYYSVFKGLFIGSFNESRILSTLDHLQKGNAITSEKNLSRIASTAGKNVDANIYFNFSRMGQIGQLVFDPVKLPAIKDLNDFGDWTETDLKINNDEILLNGYTLPKDTAGQLLNLFEQEPQDIVVAEILPADITHLFFLGFESFDQYLLQWKKFKIIQGEQNNQLETLQRDFGIDIHKEVITWVGNELAIAGLSGSKGQPEFLLAIHTRDIKSAQANLDGISKKAARRSGEPPFSKTLGEYTIGKIEIPNFTGTIFGPLFEGITEHYYLPLKDYIIFANTPDLLFELIERFYSQKTLAEDHNYQVFSNNISDKANIYFYTNIRTAVSYFPGLLAGDLKSVVRQNEAVFQNFEGLAVQMSYVNGMFYTSLYAKYNPDFVEENPSAWETTLEAEIYGGPNFITNHNTGKLNIVVFDKKNQMYLLDQVGQIKWKISLFEPPVSNVFTIDFYNNGKLQYLFNTENYLYLVDLNGNPVEDYPHKLLTRSTNPLSVVDYENKEDYRLFLAMTDNRIYNFNTQAKMVEGWSKVQAKTTVKKPVQHLVAGRKDYLFVTDENGSVTIVNRRGEERIKPNPDIMKADNSRFFLNKTNSKGLFITTDKTGKLVYIADDGSINRTEFGKFSSEHYFLYEDITGNNALDFIFADGSKLSIFDRFKKILTEVEFSSTIADPPLAFTGKNGENYLAVLLRDEEKVRILDKNGNSGDYQNIIGSTPFIVGSLNNNDQLNLIIGSGNKLLNYLLE